jgi:hypothetical protein
MGGEVSDIGRRDKTEFMGEAIAPDRPEGETFGNHDPSARWTFFDPAPPRFAAGAGCPEKSPMRALRDPISKLRKISRRPK